MLQRFGYHAQHPVTDQMSVGVVDRFEAVDVEKKYPIRRVVLAGFCQALHQSGFGVSAVAHLCQRIEIRSLFQFSDPLQCGEGCRIITEHFGSSHNFPLLVVDGVDAHNDRHTVTIRVVEEDPIGANFAVEDGFCQRAERMAQGGALFVYVHQNIIVTIAADHAGSIEPGEFLCGAIPIPNLTLVVCDVQAFGQVIQNGFIPIRGIKHGSDTLCNLLVKGVERLFHLVTELGSVQMVIFTPFA